MLGRMRKSEFCEVVRPAKRTRKQEDATLDIFVVFAATAEFQVLWHLANVLVVKHAPLHTCTPGARWCILTQHSGRACSFHVKCSTLSMTHDPALRIKKNFFFILVRTRAYVSSVEILPWLSPQYGVAYSCTSHVLLVALLTVHVGQSFFLHSEGFPLQKKSRGFFSSWGNSWGLMSSHEDSWVLTRAHEDFEILMSSFHEEFCSWLSSKHELTVQSN